MTSSSRQSQSRDDRILSIDSKAKLSYLSWNTGERMYVLMWQRDEKLRLTVAVEVPRVIATIKHSLSEVETLSLQGLCSPKGNKCLCCPQELGFLQENFTKWSKLTQKKLRQNSTILVLIVNCEVIHVNWHVLVVIIFV